MEREAENAKHHIKKKKAIIETQKTPLMKFSLFCCLGDFIFFTGLLRVREKMMTLFFSVFGDGKI